MLPPEAGMPLIRRELTAGGTRGEIVIGQSLGVLLKEWDDDRRTRHARSCIARADQCMGKIAERMDCLRRSDRRNDSRS